MEDRKDRKAVAPETPELEDAQLDKVSGGGLRLVKSGREQKQPGAAQSDS